MGEAKYEVVTGLNTRVYVGSQSDCPIRCFNESFELTGIEVEDNALVLLYEGAESPILETVN